MANGIMRNGAILWIFFRLSPQQTPFTPLRLAGWSPEVLTMQRGGEEGRYEKKARFLYINGRGVSGSDQDQ